MIDNNYNNVDALFDNQISYGKGLIIFTPLLVFTYNSITSRSGIEVEQPILIGILSNFYINICILLKPK